MEIKTSQNIVAWNKGLKIKKPAWNKDLIKETDLRLKKLFKSMKGDKNYLGDKKWKIKKEILLSSSWY